ncbi:WXG100 family type VII secretion target [Rathayibacter sp. VKM Ac-2803]|uniref:WXG100 family type VII secretion target n=1 Tax=unclassified Rathayibacter TaxID=2609250 RepID=UPI00135BD34D|nr:MULTISPECIES: WXG100 family type VII secretion target [unclassified Rathayibacter]MWV50749.1 WXG100 family type VII secretion target [Rathayibacter sp. VKM Ac-2803]MWV57230.1 WXG100 family type VII secretion target [Rathayibacter sp. VKM Ac-2754]
MTHYQADADAITSMTGTAHGYSERIQAEVDGLLGHLMSLESSWTGQAATAFQGIVGIWRTTQSQVNEGLASITVALGTAGQQYADTEQANARLFAY